MMGRVEIWWRFWCLFSVQCSASQWTGTGACVGTWSAVKSQGHLASHFPYVNISYTISLLHHLQTYFFFPSAVSGCALHFLTASAPLEWLYHPSHYTSSCYFWVIPVSYVTFWTVNAAYSNIWLNSIFSFIFQLLICFSIVFICLGLFSSKFFLSIYPSLQFCITCFSFSLWCCCSLWIYSHWFQCSVINLSLKFTNLSFCLFSIFILSLQTLLTLVSA